MTEVARPHQSNSLSAIFKQILLEGEVSFCERDHSSESIWHSAIAEPTDK
jgi:hypothetical protein